MSSDSMKKSFQSISRVKYGKSDELLNFDTQNNEQCSVCAEIEPKLWSVSPCGHKICWICSLRLRALYNSKLCPICKSENDFILICKKAEDGEGFEKKLKSLPQNLNHSIAYENEVVKVACENLLQLQCPFNNSMSKSTSTSSITIPSTSTSTSKSKGAVCLKHFKTKFELRKHVQNSHELLICEICLDHKKCFTVELALYNRTSLHKHQREANHPRCQVCDRIFYSEDELNEHCRDDHELCHICQRSGRPGRYFLNYSRLEEHFGKEHYLCPEPLCRELKFVVFENELEYKAHQSEVHLSHQKLQRSQQRQLQRLNINFGENGVQNSNERSTQGQGQGQGQQLKLTNDQRNQIALNLVYGQVTDDLANRLQSLSLYQNRNDEFVENLRGTFHLNQNQIKSIFETARAYQRNEMTATDLILRVEKVLVLGSNEKENLIKISKSLSDLQLDEIKKQRLDFAISQYREKCSSFPELGIKPGPNKSAAAATTSSQSSWGSAKSKPSIDEDEKSADPFGFARSSRSSSNPPGFSSRNSSIFPASSERSVKVLQILKPNNSAAPTPSRTSDPSKNPAMLLSSLAGGPIQKKKSSSTFTPVKMTTFSSAALGSVSTTPSLSSTSKSSRTSTKLNEQEFPSLSSKTIIDSSSSSSSTTPTIQQNQQESNAFFAPSDRDQLESFTIGNQDQDQDNQHQQSGPKKTKKLVFKYGQKWNV
jgi:hypothetical protein